METLKFKVGDKVRVKSLEWYNSKKDADRLVYIDEQGVVFDKTMANLCGKIVKIEEVNRTGYFIWGNVGFFEDWMLEDETINEEMTKKDVFQYLKYAKILCSSTQESFKVQEKLFELGIEWDISGKRIDELKYLLIIEENLLKYTPDIDYWIRNIRYKQINPSEILAIQIKEEKPKFDPSTLQPFDKVLVRDDENEEWSCNLYSHQITSENKYKYKCIYDPYVMCIPYNDDTKHLLGTKNKAPEFYRI